MLFFLIFMRMSGFIFLNPILGRRNIPVMVKSGLTMALTLLVYSTAAARGTVGLAAGTVDTPIVFGVYLLKEFAIGFFIGYIIQFFDMITVYAGTVIDFQLGISMAQIYDPQNGTQVAMTGNIFRFFFLLLFFASDGHLVLMKLLVTSGDIIPYGNVVFSGQAIYLMLDVFKDCVVLAMKLAFPVVAFEMIVQVAIGIMTKIAPQVNMFILGIQLRILIGFALMIVLISPIGEVLGNAITDMLNIMGQVLQVLAE